MTPRCPACNFPAFNIRYPKCEKCGADLSADLVMTPQEREVTDRREREETMRKKANEARGHNLTPDFADASEYAPRPYDYASTPAASAAPSVSPVTAQINKNRVRLRKSDVEYLQASTSVDIVSWVIAIASFCGAMFGGALYFADQNGLGAVVGVTIAFACGVVFLGSAGSLLWSAFRG